MSKVLKADGASADAYVLKSFGGVSEVWVTADVYLSSDLLASVLDLTYGPDFIDILAGPGLSGYIESLGTIPDGGDVAWTEVDGTPFGSPLISDWYTVEIHVNGTAREFFVNGSLAFSYTGSADTATEVVFGASFVQPDARQVYYLDNIFIGTSRGAGDIFAEDFEGVSPLGNFDSQSGDVSVVDDPQVISTPHGVCIAFSDATLTPHPTWTRLDEPGAYDFVAGWSISRGRSSELDKTGPGTATITLIDIDGSLDPTNASGPFYGDLDPMKQAAISLQNPVDETWHTVFRGFVSEWLYEMDVSEKFATVTLECADAFDLLAALEMTPGHHGDTPPVTSQGDIFFNNAWAYLLITKALDDAGWPSSERMILTGNVIVGSANPVNGVLGVVYARRDQLLTVLFDCADAEFPGVSNVYVDKIGRITFHGRYARFDPTNPDYGIDFWSAGDKLAYEADADIAPIAGLSFRRSKDDIINASLMLPQGVNDSDVPGSLVKDDTSIAKYGWRSISFDNLLTFKGRTSPDTLDFDVSAVDETKLYSQYYVHNYKNPRTRVTRVSFRPVNPDDFSAAALWDLMCRIDIGDVLHLKTTHPGDGGFDDDFYVEGIRYTAAPMRTDIHDVTLELDVSPKSLYDFNPFA